MSRVIRSFGLLVIFAALICPLAVVGSSSEENEDSREVHTPAALGNPFVGSWLRIPEKTDWRPSGLGRWLQIKADGSWYSIRDHYGMSVERTGTWNLAGGRLFLETESEAFFEVEDEVLVETRSRFSDRQDRWQRATAPPDGLLELPPIPETVEDSVAVLREMLTEEEEERIREVSEFQLRDLMFDLGISALDLFDLRGDNRQLRGDSGSEYLEPYVAEEVITRALWEDLRKERLDYRELKELEQLLHTRISGFPVREMSIARLVQEIDEALNEALIAERKNPDAIRLVIVYESWWAHFWPFGITRKRVNFFPQLEAWGRDEWEPPQIEAADLLGFVETKLVPPSTIEVHPENNIFGSFPPTRSTTYRRTNWRGDAFEVMTQIRDLPGPGISAPWGVYRTARWEMTGDEPPMPTDEAINLFQRLRFRASAESIVEIQWTGSGYHQVNSSSSVESAEPEPVSWTYWVTNLIQTARENSRNHLNPYLRIGNQQFWGPILYPKVLASDVSWKPGREPVPLSPKGAYRALFHHLEAKYALKVNMHDFAIRLIRLYPGDGWYYELSSENGPEDPEIFAFVRLDGSVVPFEKSSD